MDVQSLLAHMMIIRPQDHGDVWTRPNPPAVIMCTCVLVYGLLCYGMYVKPPLASFPCPCVLEMCVLVHDCANEASNGSDHSI